MEIPSQLSEKASAFPESSYGSTNVVLVLKDKRTIENVVLAWGTEIVKIDNEPIEGIKNLGFKLEDIIDVLPSSR